MKQSNKKKRSRSQRKVLQRGGSLQIESLENREMLHGDPLTVFEQPASIPDDNNLGPFASVDRTLGSDPFEAKAWDNFSIGADASINRISWVGAYIEPFATGTNIVIPETDFLVEIFSNASNAPGAVLHSFELDAGVAGVSDGSVASTLLSHTAEFDGPVYSYNASLPATDLAAGDYWISITALQTFPNETAFDPTWQWHLADSTDADGFFFFDDYFDTPGDLGVGKVDQEPAPTNNQPDKDLAFKLYSTGTSSLELDKFLWDINGSPHLTTDINVGDELLYAFEVTNDGNTTVGNVTVTDPLPGITIQAEVLEKFVVHEQASFIASSGDLGVFASVEATPGSPTTPQTTDPYEAKAWDNFTLGSETVLDGVDFSGVYAEAFAFGTTPQTSFSIEFYNDNAGVPGTLESAVVIDGGDAGVNDANVTSTFVGTAPGGGSIFDYEAAIPFTVLAAGDYWVSVTAVQTFPNAAPAIDPTWQWQLGTNPGGADGFFSFDDIFDDAGDNGVGDNNQPPTPVNFEAGKDLAFTLNAARQVPFDGELDPGETVVFIGAYTVTADDVANGEIVNTATVTGDGPDGTAMDMDTEVVEIDMPPVSSIDIDKFLWDINGSPELFTDLQVGDELLYSFDITNTGETDLTNVVVTDALPGVVFQPQVVAPFTAFSQEIFIPDDGNLGPFASVDRLLDSDPFEAKAWDNFSFSDATIVDGLSWAGAYIEPFANAGPVPLTDFLIEIFPDDSNAPGATPSFTFNVNGGAAGVNDANVTSTLLGHTAEFGGPVFAYDAMLPFTVVPAGDYWVSITALQTFPTAAPGTSGGGFDPTWQWHLGANSSGTADGFYSFDDTFDDAGDNNVGDNDQPATPVQFESSKDLAFEWRASREIDFDGSLAPGETVMFMATYFVTQADIDAGEIINTGTVSADGPDGAVMAMDTHETIITQPINPIDIQKTLWDVNGSPNLTNDLQVGDELIYSFDITNNGSEDISGIEVTDSLPDFTFDEQVAVPFVAHHQARSTPSSGDFGVFSSFDRVLNATSDPFEAKAWDNFSVSDFTVIEGVSFSGVYDGPFVGSAQPETDFLIEIFEDSSGLPGAPVLTFHADGGLAGVDDANVPTTAIAGTAPGGGSIFEYDAMLPLTGLEIGDYWISITADQTFPSDSPTIDPTWQWHLGSGPGDGFYSFDDIFDDPGDNGVGDNDQPPTPALFVADKDLAFTLNAVELSDFDGELSPGESVMFMGTYFVTQADVDAGQIVNTGTVTGALPNGDAVSDSDQHSFGITQPIAPSLFADINNNGAVDFADFLILSRNFGEQGGSDDGDINGDGVIDFADFLLLSDNFGQVASAQAVDAVLAELS